MWYLVMFHRTYHISTLSQASHCERLLVSEFKPKTKVYKKNPGGPHLILVDFHIDFRLSNPKMDYLLKGLTINDWTLLDYRAMLQVQGSQNL